MFRLSFNSISNSMIPLQLRYESHPIIAKPFSFNLIPYSLLNLYFNIDFYLIQDQIRSKWS